jgi:hypothetical protein
MRSSHSSQKHSAAQNQGLAVRGLADRSNRWRPVTGAAAIVALGIGPMSVLAFALIAR